jgi:CHASE2 domain-containing sensor protein
MNMSLIVPAAAVLTFVGSLVGVAQAQKGKRVDTYLQRRPHINRCR